MGSSHSEYRLNESVLSSYFKDSGYGSGTVTIASQSQGGAVPENQVEESIVSTAEACIGEFEQCIVGTDETVEDARVEISELLDTECARFKIWANNIGVFAAGHASLDHRLRDSPHVRDLMLGQLHIIKKHLARETHRKLAPGEVETNTQDENIEGVVDDSDSDSGSSVSTPTEPPEGLPLSSSHEVAPVRGSISRLHRLSVAIRKPALVTQNSKAARYKELNEEGDDIFEVFEKRVALPLVQLKLPDSGEMIQQRLSRAMAFRRRRFHYRQRHQIKLRGPRVTTPKRQYLSAEPTSHSTLWDAKSADHGLPKLRDRFAKVAALDKAESVLSDTTASKFEESRFRPDDASTKASSIFSGTGSQNHKLDIPPPPRIPEGAVEFSCPHCCLVLPVAEAKPRRWRLHLMRDLEPYVCLVDNCPDSEHLFRDRGTWHNHMRTHSTEWRCSLPGHNLAFTVESEYNKHMQHEHTGAFTTKQLESLKMRSARERPGSSPFISCPLCNWNPCTGNLLQETSKPGDVTTLSSLSTEQSRSLNEHMAKHLQFLSLYCLAAQYDVDEEIFSDKPSLRRADSHTTDNPSFTFNDDSEESSVSHTQTDEQTDFFEEPADIPPADMSSPDDWSFVDRKHDDYPGHDIDPTMQSFIRRVRMNALLAEGKMADPNLPCRPMPLQRNRGFYGRETILQKLQVALSPQELPPIFASANQSAISTMILQGEGGVGKTQIAAQFAHANMNAFDVILWAHADEPSKLARDFNRMAIQLGLVSENSAEARDHLFTRDLLRTWLMNPCTSYEVKGSAPKAKWLIIFDHVISPDILNKYWPIGGSTGSILITTRRTMPWNVAKFPVCPVEPFSEEEAVAFLGKISKRECKHEHEHARLLARRVNGYPHELNLLSRIIVKNDYSLCQFLERYDEKQSQREVLELNIQDLAASARDDFFSGWALEVLEGKSADLLDVLSMLDPDAVSEVILTASLKTVYIENYPNSRSSYEEARSILLSYSLVSRDRTTGNLIQHRLVQDAARRQMTRNRTRSVFNTCVQLINAVWPWQAFTFRHTIRRWPKCEVLFPHIIRLRKWGKQIDTEITDLNGAYEYARLLSDAGWHYHEIGRSLESEEFLNIAQRICDNLKPFYPLDYSIETDESPTEGQIDNIIAEIHHTRGCIAAEMNRPKEALAHQMAFNDMMIKQLGDGPLGTDMRLGISWAQLGAAYMVNDDYTKGEECCIKAIRVMKRLDDYENFKISLPLVNLGLAYWLTGRDDHAVITLQEGVKHREMAFGLNDRESFITGRFYHALGNVKASQGLLDEAFDYHRKARDHYKLTLGKGHHRTADTCIKLSDHYTRLGDFDMALELFEHALSVYQGREIYSPEKARALFKRSKVYESLARVREADQDGEEALRLYRLSKPKDTRSLDELDGTDFDNIIVFWSR